MLTDVFDSMRASFQARGFPGEVLWGHEKVSDHSDGPRVVIYPASDTFSAKGASLQGAFPTNGLNPRPIATRMQGGVANLWAMAPDQRDPAAQVRANYAALDQLINMTAVALHNASAGQFTLAGGDPVNDASQMHHGLSYDLAFAVAVPIIDVPWVSVGITADNPKTFGQGPVTTVDVTTNLEDPQ